MTTRALAMKTRSSRRWLAAAADVQVSFTCAVFWFGDRRSGRLTQEAAMIAPSSRPFWASISRMWSSFSGTNVPSHGTNFIIKR